MTENSIQIAKVLVQDQPTKLRLKQALIQSADSGSTRRNRQHFWNKFKEWCEEHGNSPLPAEPDTVVFYLLDQARHGQKKSTLNNMRWAIDTIHQQQGLTAPTDDPEAKQQIKGLFRTMVEQRPEQVIQSKKKPITINQIRIMDFPKGVFGYETKPCCCLALQLECAGLNWLPSGKNKLKSQNMVCGLGFHDPSQISLEMETV
jgi:hypothetical protein